MPPNMKDGSGLLLLLSRGVLIQTQVPSTAVQSHRVWLIMAPAFTTLAISSTSVSIIHRLHVIICIGIEFKELQ